jgi:hypothetical protein
MKLEDIKPIDIPECESCGQDMTLDKKFETKPRGKNKISYRVRRFKCGLCETYQTIFADGQKEQYNIYKTINSLGRAL